MQDERQRWLLKGQLSDTVLFRVFSRFPCYPSQYVATQCGVVYELGERRETDMVGQVNIHEPKGKFSGLYLIRPSSL